MITDFHMKHEKICWFILTLELRTGWKIHLLQNASLGKKEKQNETYTNYI